MLWKAYLILHRGLPGVFSRHVPAAPGKTSGGGHLAKSVAARQRQYTRILSQAPALFHCLTSPSLAPGRRLPMAPTRISSHSSTLASKRKEEDHVADTITGKRVGGERHAAVASEATAAVLPLGCTAGDESVTSPLA
jgi:hypothetical protein